MDACITQGPWADTPQELANIQPSLADSIRINKQIVIYTKYVITIKFTATSINN